MVSSWIKELSAVIAATPRGAGSSMGEIKFRVGVQEVGLNLTTGEITDGSNACAELACSDEMLERIVRGIDTLQSAFRQGKILLTGDPEPFLRLAIVLDRGSALKMCAH